MEIVGKEVGDVLQTRRCAGAVTLIVKVTDIKKTVAYGEVLQVVSTGPCSNWFEIGKKIKLYKKGDQVF